MMKKPKNQTKTDRFNPELDGLGRVKCPADQKVLQRLRTPEPSSTMAAALSKAKLLKKG